MDKQQKQQNGTDFLDTLMKTTVDMLAILSRMPRAENDNAATNENAATNDLEIAPASKAENNNEKDENEQEQPSFLHQLALQKGLLDLGQEHSNEEELKRIKKMKLLDFDMKQYAIDNDGKQPSTQEMVAMMANAGLSVDDIKSIAGAKGSGATNPQFGSWESNGWETGDE